MFLAHYGVAMGLKKVAPKTSLAALVFATSFIDLLWPVLLLFGIEKVAIEEGITKVTPLNFYYYPFSHSLVAVCFWSILIGALYFYLTKYRDGAFVVAFTVFSHWLLDLIVHRPDLPLGLNGNKFFGFGLWNSLVITMILEIGIFLFGFYLYNKNTVSLDRSGKYLLYGLTLFLIIIYLANIFSPTPPSVEMIAYAGNSLWIFVLWSYFIDKNRELIN